MKKNGFSLISALISVAIAGIVMASSLVIIQSITSSLNFSNASNEVVNQLYELKAALIDPETCLQNFRSVTLTATEAVELKNPLRPLDLNTKVLDPKATLLPNAEAQPGLRAYATNLRLRLSPNTSSVAHLRMDFESRSFATVSIVRQLPLFIVRNGAGQITACTAGTPQVLIPGGEGSSSGHCDAVALPTNAAGLPSESDRKEIREQLCNRFQFPTPAEGPEVSCAVLKSIMTRYGGRLGYLEQYEELKYDSKTEVAGCKDYAKLPSFSSLDSKESCLSKPYFAEGSTIIGGAIVGMRSGEEIFSCINGRWARTGIFPVANPNDSPGGAE